MSKSNRRPFKSYFTNNVGLKLLSILFAVILWSFVITETNQERTKQITGIPVVIEGLNELEAKGLTVRDNLTENPLTVDVKVNVSHSDYKFIDKNFISATVDISKISSECTATLPVIVSFGNVADVSLASVNPVNAAIVIDSIVSKDVPVSLSVSGELQSGLISLSPVVPHALTVSGARYYVERITKAVVGVDLSTLRDGEVLSAICDFTDEKNNSIKFAGERVNVDMDIQTVKEVPINVSASGANADKVADGYIFNGMTAGKVLICGHKNAIEKITEISAAPIDLTGKNSSFTSAPLEFILPEGISLVPDQSTPEAAINISERNTDATFTCPVLISGIPAGHSVTLTSGTFTKKYTSDGATAIKASITLTGPQNMLSSINSSDIIVKLSVANKEPGSYEMTPIVALSPSYASVVTAQLVSPSQISVTLQ